MENLDQKKLYGVLNNILKHLKIIHLQLLTESSRTEKKELENAVHFPDEWEQDDYKLAEDAVCHALFKFSERDTDPMLKKSYAQPLDLHSFGIVGKTALSKCVRQIPPFYKSIDFRGKFKATLKRLISSGRLIQLTAQERRKLTTYKGECFLLVGNPPRKRIVKSLPEPLLSRVRKIEKELFDNQSAYTETFEGLSDSEEERQRKNMLDLKRRMRDAAASVGMTYEEQAQMNEATKDVPITSDTDYFMAFSQQMDTNLVEEDKHALKPCSELAKSIIRNLQVENPEMPSNEDMMDLNHTYPLRLMTVGTSFNIDPEERRDVEEKIAGIVTRQFQVIVHDDGEMEVARVG